MFPAETRVREGLTGEPELDNPFAYEEARASPFDRPPLSRGRAQGEALILSSSKDEGLGHMESFKGEMV